MLSVDEMIPAAGQGILAVQGRRDMDWGWVHEVDDPASRAAALAERQFIRVLGGGCTSPSAAHAEVSGNELRLIGLCWSEESGQYSRGVLCGDVSRAEQAGEELAKRLRREAEQG